MKRKGITLEMGKGVLWASKKGHEAATKLGLKVSPSRLASVRSQVLSDPEFQAVLKQAAAYQRMLEGARRGGQSRSPLKREKSRQNAFKASMARRKTRKGQLKLGL